MKLIEELLSAYGFLLIMALSAIIPGIAGYVVIRWQAILIGMTRECHEFNRGLVELVAEHVHIERALYSKP